MTLEEMARLHGAAFVVPRPWSAAEIAAVLASPFCFVLEAEGGFLIGRVVAGEAELLTIAVDPMAQGRGVGAALVARFLAEVRLRQGEGVFLEVAETNAAALALYAKAGFVATGRRRGYFGPEVDGVVMTLTMTG